MSVNSKDFKTKTFTLTRQNPLNPKYWGVAIDIGYSSVKTYSPNIVASFPSYAKKVPFGMADNPIGKLDKNFIAYRDEENNEYFVGDAAQSRLKTGESDSSTAALYTRSRYYSPEFKVIMRVGIALGMMKNQYGDPTGKTPCIQTGLPPEYLSTDKEQIVDVFAGHHKFQIKFGTSDWIDFEFDIDAENNIKVIPQPMGTLISVATNDNGGANESAREYFSSNVLIFDPGFGTLDTFDIKNHYLDTSKTWDNLGMKNVLERACEIIKEEYDTNITIPMMQKVLEDGHFKTKFDHKTRSVKSIDIEPILDRANKEVCSEALNTLCNFYNNLQDQDYLIVTGGTGKAWYPYIKEYFKGMETLKVVPSWGKDAQIPAIFSNVRGYYMNLNDTLKKRG